MGYRLSGFDYLKFAEANETVNNSIALQNDDELLFQYKQDLLYEVEVLVTFNVANTTNGGMRFNCVATNTPAFTPRSVYYSMEDFDAQVTITNDGMVGAADRAIAAAVFDDIAVDYSWFWRGIFQDTVGDGTFQFQFAQNTAVVAPGGITRVGDGSKSYIRMREYLPVSELL